MIEFVGGGGAALNSIPNLPLERFKSSQKEIVEAFFRCYSRLHLRVANQVSYQSVTFAASATMIGARSSTPPPVEDELEGRVNYLAGLPSSGVDD